MLQLISLIERETIYGYWSKSPSPHGATLMRVAWLAVGIHQTAIYCGIIVGRFSGYVADSPMLGWRFAFHVAGVAGALYAIPLIYFLRDNRPVSAMGDLRKSDSFSVSTMLRELITNRSFILLVLCFTLPALAGWVVKDWMPAILKEKFPSISQGMAGVSATLYVNIASLLGAFAGGWLADRLMRKSLRGRIYVSAVGMTLLIPALFGIGDSKSLQIAILFLVLFGLGWGLFDCNNMPILSQIVRPELRATGYGIMNMLSIIPNALSLRSSSSSVATWPGRRLRGQPGRIAGTEASAFA